MKSKLHLSGVLPSGKPGSLSLRAQLHLANLQRHPEAMPDRQQEATAKLLSEVRDGLGSTSKSPRGKEWVWYEPPSKEVLDEERKMLEVYYGIVR